MIIVDFLSQETTNVHSHLTYTINGEKDIINLEHLYYINLTLNLGKNPFQNEIITSSVYNTWIIIDSIKYCARCSEYDIKIIDSIDINKDGIRELFIFRKSHCYVKPSNEGPYGVGCQQQSYGQYEVWDLASKRKIFEFSNKREISIAITVNVGRTFGYKFDVNLSREGDFSLSNLSGDGNKLKMGTYVWNTINGNYNKD